MSNGRYRWACLKTQTWTMLKERLTSRSHPPAFESKAWRPEVSKGSTAQFKASRRKRKLKSQPKNKDFEKMQTTSLAWSTLTWAPSMMWARSLALKPNRNGQALPTHRVKSQGSPKLKKQSKNSLLTPFGLWIKPPKLPKKCNSKTRTGLKAAPATSTTIRLTSSTSKS